MRFQIRNFQIETFDDDDEFGITAFSFTDSNNNETSPFTLQIFTKYGGFLLIEILLIVRLCVGFCFINRLVWLFGSNDPT